MSMTKTFSPESTGRVHVDDDDCKISRGLHLEILNTLCEIWKQKFRLKSSLNEFLNTSTVNVTLHLLSEKNKNGLIK